MIPKPKKRKKSQRTALAGLVRAGFGTWEHVEPGPAGGPPTRAFRLSRGGDGDATSKSPPFGGVVSPSPPRKKSQRTALAGRAMKLWGQIVHAREAKCECEGWNDLECGGPLQAAHGLSRRKTRDYQHVDPGNGFLLCRDHHCQMGTASPAWLLFLKHQWGESAFWYRMRAADHGELPTVAGYRDRIARFEAELKEMK